MKRLLAVVIFVCIISSWAIFVSADIVKLKDGREINGRLKEITDDKVVLYMNMGSSQGEIWFSKDKIESINDLSLEEAEARISTEKAFITRDKDRALSSSVSEGLNFVSKTRKKEFKEIPKLKIVDKETIKGYLNQQIERYYSKEKLETKRKLLLKLGLIPKDLKYSELITDALAQEIAGLYRPDTKNIYISEATLSDILPGMPNMTVMHEQVHALQDQYYDLASIEEAMLSDNQDKSLAVKSIIEGEATVLMYDASLRSVKSYGAKVDAQEAEDLRTFVIDSMLTFSKRIKNKDGKPAIFTEDLLFPYVWGGSFVQFLVNTKGWEAIDEIFQKMPASTEQIMHPEKYFIVRDEPLEVRLPDLSGVLGDSWTKLTEDVMGEFSTYLIGKNFLDELSSKMMSEGWGGDYFELYESAGLHQALLIWLSKWDNARDAQEFFDLYKKVLAKKYEGLSLISQEPDSSQWDTEDGKVYLARSDDSVLVIEGATEDILPGLIEAVTLEEEYEFED